MKLCPNFQLSVLQEAEFKEKMSEISETLAKYRQEGTFSGFDGKELYYEYFQVQDSRGAVVVVHGLSEFTKKYHEFAWHLLNQGYDVFLYDQRCHGQSCRLTERQDLIHVDAFGHYQKDLDCFIRDVVRKATDGPLYLYSHSMGGAVALEYLSEHPSVFQKAVLSAPMIEPLTGDVPVGIARMGLTLYVLFGNRKKKFWFCKDFDPDYPFERASDQSLARFQRNMDIRLADARFRTTPQTVRWIQQSICLRRKFTSKRFLKKLQTPILMLSAENDKIVCGKAQAEFADKCPICKRIVIPGTTHAMLNGTLDTITEHIQQVLDHFR